MTIVTLNLKKKVELTINKNIQIQIGKIFFIELKLMQ